MEMNFTEAANMSDNYDSSRIDFPQFVVYITLQFAFFLLEFYLIASFSRYIKLGRQRSKNKSGHRGFSKKRQILIGFLIFVIVTGILRSGELLQILFLPNHSPQSAYGCSILMNIFYVIYVAGVTGLYIFLWFRQHTLYVLPSLQRLVSPFIRRFNNSLLPLIILAGIGSSIAFVFANPPEKITYVPETQMCLFPLPSNSPVFYVSVAAYALVVVLQVSILFCFVYILRRHQTNLRSKSGSIPRSLYPLIKNCSIAAAVAIATDIATIIVSFFLPSSAQLYNLLLYDVDFIVNVGCAIFCFKRKRGMLDPWNMTRICHEKRKTFFQNENKNRVSQNL